MENKEEKLKEVLLFGINEISEALNPQFQAINGQVLVKMVNCIWKNIQIAKFPIDCEPYQKAFKNIMIGKHQIYSLNVIALMVIFRIEVLEFRDPTYRTPEIW